MPDAPPPPVLALCRDLIFASKITAAARARGLESKILRDPAQLAGHSASLLLVDLNQPGVLAAAAEWGRAEGGTVVGFVSHVDAATIDEARRAGIDRIMARSGFVQALPELLGSDGNAK
jgi:hypothetical protein